MMQLLQWQTKGTEDWEVCSTCWKPLSENKKNKDYLCFLNCKRNHCQLSASTTMIQSSEPALVYQRRKKHKNSLANSNKPFPGSKHNGHSLSSINSESPTMSFIERVASLNDNCSSSKSNLELSSSSLKIDMDDTGECSCSGELVSEKVLEEMSERDKCIAILRNQGIIDGVVWTGQEREETGSEQYCSKTCKVCERLESTVKLLICDSCEDAFHVSCSNNLKGTRIPVGEWLCNSCLKKKHKILKEKCNGNTEFGRIGELGSLEFMFRDTEPYMTSVRIGDEFQAQVPDWSGPTNDESDLIGEPVEAHPANNLGTQQRNFSKSLMLNSIGNWLQCQEVIAGTGQGVDEPICGKWRRAPLFEVQTDDWECFSSVLWDRTHADCAVPQELDTEAVMKQLKYVEMLRPKLVAKRRKLDCSKSNGS